MIPRLKDVVERQAERKQYRLLLFMPKAGLAILFLAGG
jgi:hypothetical protein